MRKAFGPVFAYGGLLAVIFMLSYQTPTGRAILGVQTPPKEAYPGQSQHAEPPKGFYCSAQAKDAAHKCTCKRVAIKTKEDPDCCDAVPMEDKGCTVWCWPGHCTCPIKCETGGGHDMEHMEHGK